MQVMYLRELYLTQHDKVFEIISKLEYCCKFIMHETGYIIKDRIQGYKIKYSKENTVQAGYRMHDVEYRIQYA